MKDNEGFMPCTQRLSRSLASCSGFGSFWILSTMASLHWKTGIRPPIEISCNFGRDLVVPRWSEVDKSCNFSSSRDIDLFDLYSSRPHVPMHLMLFSSLLRGCLKHYGSLLEAFQGMDRTCSGICNWAKLHVDKDLFRFCKAKWSFFSRLVAT